MTTCAERLGFGSDDRVVIVNCDDFGLAHSVNVAIEESIRLGSATSASLMVPTPWAREAVGRSQGLPVGVHLTLNFELPEYRWGPITQAPSLLDGDGGLPRTVVDLWEHADIAEVRRECRAQVERAMLWGLEVTHLDSHMGALQLRPEFFDVYLELAVDFDLPIRMLGAAAEPLVGFPFRSLAADNGVWFPDHFVYAGGVGSRAALTEALKDLRPGLTELYLHPTIDTEEIAAMTPSAPQRVDDFELLRPGGWLEEQLAACGAATCSFSELRDGMRRA